MVSIHGGLAPSNVILRASKKSKILANSPFLLFAPFFDFYLPLIINVLSELSPREQLQLGNGQSP
jgi:hypothetical protein